MTELCIFCEIAEGNAPATFVAEWDRVIAIMPLNPVVPGHVLVLPRKHVADFTESPYLSGEVMQQAGWLAREMGPCNLITSVGPEATQSIFHLHLHLVPRRYNDGLALPWHPGKA
jgi:histidine triad (HIT) family protein